MFEYLMPLLVMPTYERTLLDQTYRAVVERQIEYGRERGVPWGISESGYNKTDAQLNYQYRAFGVPGLGLQARPGRRPGRRALRQRAGADGRRPRPPARTCGGWRATASSAPYGFYEAIDYTPARLPPRQEPASPCARSWRTTRA